MAAYIYLDGSYHPILGAKVFSGGTAFEVKRNDAIFYHGEYRFGNLVSGEVLVGALSSGMEYINCTVSGGNARVLSGGTTHATSVSKRGIFYIASGGTALQTMENGGYVNFADGAYVTFASNSFSGVFDGGYEITVHSGTTANSVTISELSLDIYSGGTATYTTNNDGLMFVFSGGSTYYTTVNSGGELWVYSGGTANSITVNSGGSLKVRSGGIALNVTSSAGAVIVSSAGATITYTNN